MSLILDALRRAERERERDLGRRLTHALPPRARRSRGWLGTVAVLVVVLAVGGVYVSRQSQIGSHIGDIGSHSEEIVPPAARTGSSLAEITLREPEPAPRQRVPVLQELPEPVRTTVPALTLNAHFWSSDPARRFVLIGMQRYREGDTVRDGLRLVEIVPEGAEMDWRGTRFRILKQ